MRQIRKFASVAGGALLLIVGTAGPVLAHDQPDGANWLMADWMLLSWFAFFLAGFVAFIVALRRGLLSNLERDKSYLLEITEPDYYTPDWARDEEEEKEGRDDAER